MRDDVTRLLGAIDSGDPDAAEALGISEPTTKRQWNYVRLWLFNELRRMAE